MVSSLIKTFAAVALAMPGAVLASLSKPALWPNLDFLHAGLAANLPSHSYTVSTFIDGYIATACLERAQADGFDPWDITTYVVTFNDVILNTHFPLTACPDRANRYCSAPLSG